MHDVSLLYSASVLPKEFKRGNRGLFLTPAGVNAMRRRPYCLSRMEVSYCTFGFGAIIRLDLRTLSLLRDSLHYNQYAWLIRVHTGKATHA